MKVLPSTRLLVLLPMLLFASTARSSVVFLEDFASDTLGVFSGGGNASLVIPPFSPSVGLSGISALLETSGFGGGSLLLPDLETFVGITSSSGNLNDAGAAPPFVINGTAIKTTVSHQAGDILSFDYNLLTQDIVFGPRDFAFVFIDNSIGGFAAIDSATAVNTIGSIYTQETGVKSYSQVIANTGTSTLAIGIVNVGDAGFQSALVLDNIQITTAQISEPLAIWLIFSGLIPLAARRRGNC